MCLFPWVLGACVLGLASLPVRAALPSPVKPGHPRVLLSAGRIAEVKAVTVPPVVSRFPQARGRLSVDFVPRFATPSERALDTPVIDIETDRRNHLFVRHVAALDRPADGRVALQVALQGAAGYLAQQTFLLPANEASTVVLEWDAMAREAVFTLGGEASVHRWRTGAPWRADGQRLMLRGRAGEQVLRLQVDDLSTGTTVLARGPIDMKLQDALQQFLRPEALLETQTTGLLRCAAGAGCAPPYADLATTRHPDDVEGLARSLALAWLLSDEPRYLEAARRYTGLLLAIDPLSGPPGGEEYAMHGRVGAFSILYDWLFEPLRATPAPDREGVSLAERIAQRIVDHLLARKADGTYELGEMVCGRQPIRSAPLACATEPVIEWDREAAPSAPSTAASYLAGGHARGDVAKIAQALLAIHDERVDTHPLLDTAFRHFAQGYHPARAWLSVDGGHHMNFGYGAGYNDPNLSERLWQSALQPGGARPVLDADWQYKTWLPFLYSLRGDGRLPATGDAGADPSLQWASRLVLRAAVEGGDARAQAFHDQVLLAVTRPGAFDLNSDAVVGYLWDRLFFGVSKTVPAPWTDLPLARHFRNAGFVTMRDRWSFDDATVLEFKSTSFVSVNHHHFDQNSFSLFYRAPLLLDSGAYGLYADAHWGNYLIRTLAHNSLVVPDPQNVFVLGQAWLSRDGGQALQPGMQAYPTLAEARTGRNHLQGVEAFAQGEDFAYVRGNASRAYAATTLDPDSGFVRHLLMLRRPGVQALPVVVMFDQVRLQAGREAATPTVLFHTAREPLAVGETARGAGVFELPFTADARRLVQVDNGAGRLFLETLLPRDAHVRKIGGTGAAGDFRFAVPTPDAAGGLSLVNYPPGTGSAGADAPDAGAWRLEVEAPAGPLSVAQREFLHVMWVADAGSLTLPAAARRLATSPGSAAVLLGDRLVALIVHGAPDAPVFVDLPAPATAARDLLVVGLQPGERFDAVAGATSAGAWRLTLQRKGSGSLQAGDDGVLRVTTPLRSD